MTSRPGRNRPPRGRAGGGAGRGAAGRGAEGAKRPGRRDWPLWLLGILALTFAVYTPCLRNGFTEWDDNYYVTEDPLVAHPGFLSVLTTPVASNYHPLTIWSYALNYRISGLDPSSYHWLNLLLHLANTALVFVFVRSLSRGRFWASAATALFFGIHPMHVESVAWIAERKDVLYGFFYLLGLIAYLRYLDGGRRWPWLLAAFAAFVLSVASKPAAVVFPVALLALDWFRRRPLRLPALLEKAPFVAVSALEGILTLRAQQAAGAITAVWGPFEKLLFAAYGTVMYVAKLFVPVRLSAIYPYPVLGGGLGPEFYVTLAALLVLLPAALYVFRRNRVVLFGLAFFFINIALVLQFFAIGGAVMAERYTYLSYIGLLVALTWWLDERPEQLPRGIPVRHVLAAVLLLLIPVSLYQTWNRCGVWRNAETLWNDTIAKYPRRIADAYNNRGFYYYDKAHRYDAALADFDEALALNDRSPRAWINKANTLAAMNQNDSSLVAYDRAIQLKPDWADAYNNRGAVWLRLGENTSAAADFSRAIALEPGYRDAYANRALAEMNLREFDRCAEDSKRAIELQPGHPGNYLQYGTIAVAMQQLGRHQEAVAAFEMAIRTAPPGEPRLGAYHLYRSYSWMALHDTARAREDAKEAARLGATVSPEYLRSLGG